MRILFFSTAFPQPYEPSRNPDNLERCVALGRRHAIHVISPFTWLRLGSGGERHEAYVRGIPVSRPLFFYPCGVIRGTHAWCMWHGIRRSALRTATAFRPDAVLSYWTYPDTAVAMRLAKAVGVPCVAIVGGSDVLSIDPAMPGAVGARVRRALEAVDAIAAVSDSIRHRIVSLGIDPRKIGVLSAAIDKEVFFPGPRQEARHRLDMPTEAPILVWVGRMVAVKALDVLLDAVAQLTAEWPALRLYLVGDGPLRQSLESKVAAQALTQHVVFTGRVAHRDLPDYYRAADATLLSSTWEGMPNTLVESHACGTPFVASAVGAIPQLAMADVDELVMPGDARLLANAVAKNLRRRGELRTAVPSAAGSWDEMASQLAEMLEAARGRRSVSAVAAAGPAPIVRMHRHRSPRRSWLAS